MERSNLFSKARLMLKFFGIVFGLLAAGPAFAIHLHALYTASCQRQIGIILDVGPRQISLLNLQGKIVNVDRFEVIYYASFSLDVVPVARVTNADQVPLAEVKTFQNGELVTLVRGWPVDFNKDKISFLDLRGSEVVIDRSSIWSIDYVNETGNVEFRERPEAEYEFIHPYAFNSCPLHHQGKGRFIRFYPQTLLSDPVAIKREFDRLENGHKGIRDYVSAQQFYPVPEVYKTETSLGLWLMTQSRYGASHSRDNNFTPYLVNEFSSGPFGFQSIFTSGSGPVPQSIHEETQTQVYYRMKADYFHFSGMVDPSLLLVGTKYNWSEVDLDATDMRAIESAFVEFGFDYGKVALEMYLGGATDIAARDDDLFARDAISFPRFGLRYQGYTWLFNLIGGGSSQDGFAISMVRANFQWQPSHNNRFMFSLLHRHLSFTGQASNDDTQPTFSAESKSDTAAAYGYWRVRTRYWAGLLLSVEHNVLSGSHASQSNGRTITAPKAGALVSISF